VLSASSFLVLRLTGEYVLDRHMASGFNPLYDVHDGSWIPEWHTPVLGDAGPPLPRPLWATEQAGEVTAEAAVETGLRPGTPVAAGTVDAAAEALSVGVRASVDLMLMYGSIFFLILVADRAAPPKDRRDRAPVKVGTAPSWRSNDRGLIMVADPGGCYLVRQPLGSTKGQQDHARAPEPAQRESAQ
jgi:sugar (pentulose or hexulose) kinase